MLLSAMGQPLPVPSPGQCTSGPSDGGYVVACNWDQAERALLEASLPFMYGLSLLVLLVGLALCALGPRAFAWLPAKATARLVGRGALVRLVGAAICVMAAGQLVSTAELGQSVAGGHPLPFGTAIVMAGQLAMLALLLVSLRARRSA